MCIYIYIGNGFSSPNIETHLINNSLTSGANLEPVQSL